MLVKLESALKDYLWGGVKLKEKYNKKSDTIIAESWLISCHKDGLSIVSDLNITLADYIKNKGISVLGSKALKYKEFPLLIKFLDAKQDLSIQVHPDDEYALKHEGEYGKNEMWIVLECEKDAFIYYGVNKEISKDEFRKAIEENRVLDVLKKVKVKPYDVFDIKAGTIHAVGKGMVIAEIQQSSNSTYRVFDFNRKDKFGNLRELHIDKAVDVSLLKPSSLPKDIELVDINDNKMSILLSNEYFTTKLYRVNSDISLESDETSFQGLIVSEGCGFIEVEDKKIDFIKGDSFFVEANTKYKIYGKCEVIIASL